jgi:hypothetical protein
MMRGACQLNLQPSFIIILDDEEDGELTLGMRMIMKAVVIMKMTIVNDVL